MVYRSHSPVIRARQPRPSPGRYFANEDLTPIHYKGFTFRRGEDKKEEVDKRKGLDVKYSVVEKRVKGGAVDKAGQVEGEPSRQDRQRGPGYYQV